MDNKNHINCGCGCESDNIKTETISSFDSIMSSMPEQETGEIICGPPPEPPASPFEKPGYQIQHFVEDFILTKEGYIPRIKTTTGKKDLFQTILARMNIGRNDYKVAPGLYCVGNPDENSHILVTCNYKLSFDHLRRELSGINAWILILDTRGINVWCAAGKGTFGTNELIEKITTTGISNLVSHKQIIVPQLGATGVAGHKVKKNTGFKVIWGPVNTKDLKEFLENGLSTSPEMRQVTFTLPERAVLIPVELSLVLKPALYILLGTIILSGFGKGFFSFSGLWERGIPAAMTLFTGILAGTAITPLLLNRLPGIAFSVKGTAAGLVACLPIAIITAGSTGIAGVTALVFVSAAFSSFLAMNFTGSTPFTSPSGVEKEMRMAIPVQAVAVILGVILWIYSAL